MSNENNLRDKLLNAEPVSPERQQRFREQLAQIVEPPLPRGYRLYFIIALLGLLSGLPGAVCGLLFDAEHRWIWALFVLACTAFAGWIYYILRRGSEPLRMMQGMSKASAGVGGLVAALLIFHGIQEPSPANMTWALLGLLGFLFMSFINLWNRVITAERTIREHILRVEYRLADQDRPPR